MEIKLIAASDAAEDRAEDLGAHDAQGHKFVIGGPQPGSEAL
jgi:hypothetical protein